MNEPVSNLVVCLPAYNEAASLRTLLPRIEAAAHAIGVPVRYVICDDGSSDDTTAVLCEWAGRVLLTVVTHPQNEGLGAAIRDVLKAGVKQAGPTGALLTMDADNTQPPELMGAMLARLHDGYDLVVASRYRPGAVVTGLSAGRRAASAGAGCLFRLLFPMRGVRDFTCGYRIYRAALLDAAFERYGDRFVSERGFTCMADILLKLRPLHPRCGEVPLALSYERRGSGSKMRVARTILFSLRLIAMRRLGIGMRH